MLSAGRILIVLIFTLQHLRWFFSHIHSATFAFHGGYLALEKCNKKIDKSKLYSWCWPIVTWEGKLGVICLGLACYSHWSGGAADKVELYFYLHFISLYLYLYLYLSYLLPLIDGKGGWSASTQEPQRYQTPFFVLKCCYTVKTVSPPFGDITST